MPSSRSLDCELELTPPPPPAIRLRPFFTVDEFLLDPSLTLAMMISLRVVC
jgi:hypothetical protein